jgi:hypothetical protein
MPNWAQKAPRVSLAACHTPTCAIMLANLNPDLPKHAAAGQSCLNWAQKAPMVPPAACHIQAGQTYPYWAQSLP